MGKIIGIDLGTTNSVVAVMEGKEPKVIVNEEGSRLTPSVVAWDDKGENLVGQIAKRQAVTNPQNTVYSAKRFIGRRFDEATEEGKRVPYTVVKGKSGDAVFDIRGKQVSPQEVSAKILQKLTKIGLLQSLPGTNGGYKLARSANSITALEVIRAIDGPIILTSCFTPHGECEQSEKCTVREPLRKVHEGILQLLNTITISDMSKDEPTETLLRIT